MATILALSLLLSVAVSAGNVTYDGVNLQEVKFAIFVNEVKVGEQICLAGGGTTHIPAVELLEAIGFKVTVETNKITAEREIAGLYILDLTTKKVTHGNVLENELSIINGKAYIKISTLMTEMFPKENFKQTVDGMHFTFENTAKTATPSQQKFKVDWNFVEFDAFSIDGSNYVKLRDLAYSLSDTPVKFDLSYDAKAKIITLSKGKAYTKVGGEMAKKSTENKTAKLSTDFVNNGTEIKQLKAYQIGGNNYFKLTDLAEFLGFKLYYASALNTIVIRTGNVATPENNPDLSYRPVLPQTSDEITKAYYEAFFNTLFDSINNYRVEKGAEKLYYSKSFGDLAMNRAEICKKYGISNALSYKIDAETSKKYDNDRKTFMSKFEEKNVDLYEMAWLIKDEDIKSRRAEFAYTRDLSVSCPGFKLWVAQFASVEEAKAKGQEQGKESFKTYNNDYAKFMNVTRIGFGFYWTDYFPIDFSVGGVRDVRNLNFYVYLY